MNFWNEATKNVNPDDVEKAYDEVIAVVDAVWSKASNVLDGVFVTVINTLAEARNNLTGTEGAEQSSADAEPASAEPEPTVQAEEDTPADPDVSLRERVARWYEENSEVGISGANDVRDPSKYDDRAIRTLAVLLGVYL